MIYSERYAKEIHKPAIPPQCPDVPPLVLTHKLMTREAAIMLVDIEPTADVMGDELAQMDADANNAVMIGVRYKHLFKKN